MTAAKCFGCPHLSTDGECSRYRRRASSVRACGRGCRDFNRPPYSRRGAENMRRWHKEQQEKEKA